MHLVKMKWRDKNNVSAAPNTEHMIHLHVGFYTLSVLTTMMSICKHIKILDCDRVNDRKRLSLPLVAHYFKLYFLLIFFF